MFKNSPESLHKRGKIVIQNRRKNFDSDISRYYKQNIKQLTNENCKCTKRIKLHFWATQTLNCFSPCVCYHLPTLFCEIIKNANTCLSKLERMHSRLFREKECSRGLLLGFDEILRWIDTAPGRDIAGRYLRLFTRARNLPLLSRQ